MGSLGLKSSSPMVNTANGTKGEGRRRGKMVVALHCTVHMAALHLRVSTLQSIKLHYAFTTSYSPP